MRVWAYKNKLFITRIIEKKNTVTYTINTCVLLNVQQFMYHLGISYAVDKPILDYQYTYSRRLNFMIIKLM